MTKKVSETVETAIEPAKKYIQAKKSQTVDQVDLFTKILVLGCEIFMVWKLLSEGSKEEKAVESHREPSHIVINNYISTKEDPRNDFKGNSIDV